MLALLATHRQRTSRRTTSGVIGIINICATLYAHVQDDYDDPSIGSALCVCVSFSCSGTFRRPLPVGLLHVRATLLLQKNSFCCCCCYCLAPIFALYDHIGAAGSEGISFANPFTHAHNRPHTPHALSSRVFFRVGQKKRIRTKTTTTTTTTMTILLQAGTRSMSSHYSCVNLWE